MSSREGGGVGVIMITAPDAEVAERLAHALVEEHLAACVNIVPGVTSLYRWEGTVHRAGEVLLLVKTTADTFERVRGRVRELHPYEVPEIIDLPVRTGEARYLAWIRDEVRSDA